MYTPFRRILCLGLAFSLLLTTVPLAHAQTVQNPVSPSSSDDDNTSEVVLIGLFTVVIGILIWLGIKEDYGRWGKAGEPQGYALYGEESEEGWDLVAGDAGELGLGARF